MASKVEECSKDEEKQQQKEVSIFSRPLIMVSFNNYTLILELIPMYNFFPSVIDKMQKVAQWGL